MDKTTAPTGWGFDPMTRPTWSKEPQSADQIACPWNWQPATEVSERLRDGRHRLGEITNCSVKQGVGRSWSLKCDPCGLQRIGVGGEQLADPHLEFRVGATMGPDPPQPLEGGVLQGEGGDG
jgi:hypothetical protein